MIINMGDNVRSKRATEICDATNSFALKDSYQPIVLSSYSPGSSWGSNVVISNSGPKSHGSASFGSSCVQSVTGTSQVGCCVSECVQSSFRLSISSCVTFSAGMMCTNPPVGTSMSPSCSKIVPEASIWRYTPLAAQAASCTVPIKTNSRY